jgi:hypothetical protein
LTHRDRHEINNYSQLHSMPPKKIKRSQLRVPDLRASIESLQASLSQIAPISTGRVSVLPDDENNDDEPAVTHGYEEARDPDDGKEDDDDSTLREGEDNRG